jgi:AraC family transcriptional regulator of adaptative response / DNA-3-methyladenine glycosylase II
MVEVGTLVPVLDPLVCDRARMARDRRFDGQFFTGVKTTGIYCRPICPVKPARSTNVCFFPSAAAAERAGFRPCLRCCPESAPGTLAWDGSVAILSRALLLVDRGYLDEHCIAELAAELTVGPRQLHPLDTWVPHQFAWRKPVGFRWPNGC